jgi:hypothetical protein
MSRFRRYRGRQLPFSCFALPNSFSTVPVASATIFMFCAPGLIFDDSEGVGSLFLFCVPGLIFDDTECVASRFHILRAGTHFRRYRGRRLLFSCFVLPDSFRQYRRHQLSFSCFALPDSFSAVPRGSAPVFMVCAPGLVSTVLRASALVFMFYVPGLNSSGTEGIVSRFHVLRSRTRFWRYRGRRVAFSCFALPDSFSAEPMGRVPFSCFALPNSFSAVSWASGPFFMFCAPGLVFGGIEGVRPRFHVLRSRNHFRRCRVRRVPPIFMFCACATLFRALRTALRLLAMGFRRRTRRSLLSVHLFNAG